MRKVRSLAKINLGLEIRGKRHDGYHELRTIFQTIDFYDILEFSSLASNKIVIAGDDQSIAWDETNLIYKAALLLKEKGRVKEGIQIRVHKRIPPGKGLGGGSSNAAITLATLNQIWGLQLKRNELKGLARKLGADVPYFLEGGLCLGVGRGDTITPLPELKPRYCLLVLPPLSIPTAFIYEHLPSSLTSKPKASKINKFLENRNIGSLSNDLEKVIFSHYSFLRSIKRLIKSQGCELALVSGSGSAVFGLFEDRNKAEVAYQKAKRYYQIYLVETITRDRYWPYINYGV